MKNNTQSLLFGLGIGTGIIVVVGAILYFMNKDKNKNSKYSEGEYSKDEEQKKGRSIIIGDSQTPFIKKESSKVQMLGSVGGENVLWKGGMGLRWLKDAVSKYPITKDIKNVIINIGTNGGFNSNEDIGGLVNELKRVFPNAKLFAVKGSWGWGGNKNVTETKVNSYYDKFENEGVKIINPAIGSVKDPHSNLPIYKEIGKSIDNTL
jgi:hypothetical protein